MTIFYLQMNVPAQAGSILCKRFHLRCKRLPILTAHLPRSKKKSSSSVHLSAISIGALLLYSPSFFQTVRGRKCDSIRGTYPHSLGVAKCRSSENQMSMTFVLSARGRAGAWRLKSSLKPARRSHYWKRERCGTPKKIRRCSCGLMNLRGGEPRPWRGLLVNLMVVSGDGISTASLIQPLPAQHLIGSGLACSEAAPITGAASHSGLDLTTSSDVALTVLETTGRSPMRS